MRIDCPLDDGKEYHVTIPDVWLGLHYHAYLDAMESAKDVRGVLQKFIVSIAICDDFHLPGLTGKAENWDLMKCDLRLMVWVSQSVVDNFTSCFVVPKKKYNNTGQLLELMKQTTAGRSQKAA